MFPGDSRTSKFNLKPDAAVQKTRRIRPRDVRRDSVYNALVRFTATLGASRDKEDLKISTKRHKPMELGWESGHSRRGCVLHDIHPSADELS